MTDLLPRRVLVVWSVLIAAALAALWLGTDHGIADIRIAGVVLMLVGFVKAWLVGMHFMELRDAPRPLRLLFNGWCIGVGGAVILLLEVA